ncbi:PP2C family protein-serine/threonine phosphatase [Streptomyces sp. NPDC051976]|uniref:PP2C family protein-serine/threonine phosphatase n=1 Tax=Streptomyces sp. NPDC051976 TaxID=3154947 RepID=UPI00341498AC
MGADDFGRSRPLPERRSSRSVLIVSLIVLAALITVDELTPPDIRIGGLMVAVPALSAAFLGPWAVLLVAGLTLPAVVAASAANHQLDQANFPVMLTTVVLISAGAVAASAARQRREEDLTQARWVAEMTQRALLRPLPREIGSLRISSLYLAADREAAIGGDLYAASVTDHKLQILVGDVQGKGMSAIEVVGYVINAFRRASRKCVPLEKLPGYLDHSLQEDLTAAAESETFSATSARPTRQWQMEGFVTAVMAEIAEEPDGTSLRLANCGHPPPLLIHDGGTHPLKPAVDALPIGLGGLGGAPHDVADFDFVRGDTLLLYTDGVIEARDPHGAFYPLAERLGAWTSYSPDALLDAIRGDVLEFTGGGLGDDAAMVVIHRAA